MRALTENWDLSFMPQNDKCMYSYAMGARAFLYICERKQLSTAAQHAWQTQAMA